MPKRRNSQEDSHVTQVELVLDAKAELGEGPCWLADRERLLWVDIMSGRVHLFDPATGGVDVLDYDAATGAIAARRPFAAIERPGWPDGMAVDVDGGLWVALWGGSRVVHYLPDGTIAGEIPVPAVQVSSCCFGGP